MEVVKKTRMVKYENAEEGIFFRRDFKLFAFFVNWNIDKHFSRSKQMNPHLTCVLLEARTGADFWQPSEFLSLWSPRGSLASKLCPTSGAGIIPNPTPCPYPTIFTPSNAHAHQSVSSMTFTSTLITNAGWVVTFWGRYFKFVWSDVKIARKFWQYSQHFLAI